MFGTTTLQEIREDLRRRFSLDGLDAVEWLEKRIAESPKDSDVLKSILAVIKGEHRRKPGRKYPSEAKKKR